MAELTNAGRAHVGSARPLEGPRRLIPGSVSIVIPVKDHQAGLDRLLPSLRDLSPLEVIVVDDNSATRVRAADCHSDPPLRIIRSNKPGPAGARNTGAEQARGDWLLFLDSDCTASPDLLLQYRRAIDGSLAYTGGVRASSSGRIGRFYDDQSVLEPAHDGGGSPLYVVTANALVWRRAFEAVHGFDEGFHLAAAEDVDLGLRLRALGQLAYVRDARVDHDYGGFTAFCRRFWRYGRGNARFTAKYGGPLRRPALGWSDRSIAGLFLTSVRYAAFSFGRQYEIRRLGHRLGVEVRNGATGQPTRAEIR